MNIFSYLVIILWILLGFNETSHYPKDTCLKEQFKMFIYNFICFIGIILGILLVAEYCFDSSLTLGIILYPLISYLLGCFVGIIYYIVKFSSKELNGLSLLKRKLSSFATILLAVLLLCVICKRHVLIYRVPPLYAGYITTTFSLMKVGEELGIYYSTFDGENILIVHPEDAEILNSYILKMNPTLNKDANFLYKFNLYGVKDILNSKQIRIEDSKSRVKILQSVEKILNSQVPPFM